MSLKDKKIHTEIEINAPREEVWQVLTDFEKMHEWSSSFQNLEGEFKQDGKATAFFKGPLGKTIKAEHSIIEFEEGVSFGWSDPMAMGVRDYHIFRLEDLPDGKTKFIQSDHFTQGHSWFMQLMMNNSMEKMYAKFNQELKDRVESMIEK